MLLTPRRLWRRTTDLENAVRKLRGHRFQIEQQPYEDDGSYCLSVWFVRIDGLASQLEATRMVIKRIDRVDFGTTEGAGQVYKQATKFVLLGATVCEDADLYCRHQLARAADPPKVQTVVCYGTACPPHRSGSTYGWLQTTKQISRYTGVSRGAPRCATKPYRGQILTDCFSAASGGRANLATATLFVRTQPLWPTLAGRTSRRRRESGGHFAWG